MSQCLHPCPSCAQHLRASETTCPFCDAALPSGWNVCRRAAAPGRPMSRAALLFVGATVAASCGGSVASQPGSDDGGKTTTGEGGGGGEPDAMPVALYGPAPVFDAGPRLDASPDTSEDDGGGMPIMYGPAVIDSGRG